MPLRLKIDFYHIEMPPDSPPLGDIIRKVSRSPDNESRNEDLYGYPTRLLRAESNSARWRGDLIKIRMNDLPIRAKLGGSVSLLELDDDEGIGEETAFLFDPATDVLALQRNRSGVSANAFSAYFQRKSDVDGPIQLLPVIREDAMSRLANLDFVRKLEIAIAAPTHPELFTNQSSSVKGMIDALDELEAPHAKLSVTMGHQRGSLSVENVVKIAKKLVGFDGDSENYVEKILVSGAEEDGGMDVIDLLEYRLTEVVEVEPSKRRRIAYDTRCNAILDVWQRNRAALSRMFGK